MRLLAVTFAVVAVACNPAPRSPDGPSPVPPHAPDPEESTPAGVPATPAPDAPAPTSPPPPLACTRAPDLPPVRPPYPGEGCEGVVPAEVPAPRRIVFSTGLNACGRAVPDGSGSVLVPVFGRLGEWMVWTLVFVRGDELRRIDVADGSYGLHLGTSSGFLSLRAGWHTRYPYRVDRFTPTGELVGSADVWPVDFRPSWTAAADPRGGFVLAARDGGVGESLVVRVDGSGAVVAGPERIVGGPVVGIDGEGRVLMVWDGAGTCGPGTLAARWLGPSLEPIGDVFVALEALPSMSGYGLTRTADGALLLSVNGRWARRFQDGIPAGGDPPPWAAALPEDAAIAVVREGRANAIARRSSPLIAEATGCAEPITLVSARGALCGAVEVALDGEVCGPAEDPTFGPTGTVARTRPWTPCVSTGCCELTWWPDLLR